MRIDVFLQRGTKIETVCTRRKEAGSVRRVLTGVGKGQQLPLADRPVVERGGKKPRKDLATWADAKPYMSLFYNEYFELIEGHAENFDNSTVAEALKRFLETYDHSDDMNTWFDKIKAIADELGFASDMKAYKANPDAFKGSVADISSFIRVAVTGKRSSPDMYEVMQILGSNTVTDRINREIERLA